MTTPETEPTSVQQLTRFTITLTNGQQLHGVEWPTGRILLDDPTEGFSVATSLDDFTAPLDTRTVERISDDPTAEVARLRAALEEVASYCRCADATNCASNVARRALGAGRG